MHLVGVRVLGRNLIAQRSDTGTAIQYDMRAIGGSDFHTGGIAAIVGLFRITGWYGAAHAPKTQCCLLVIHLSRIY